MLKRLIELTAPYVTPLEIDGMKGRQMHYPTRDKQHKREILFIYGIHGNMERFYGIVHYLARFGNVTMPDLPGFGGMETFYKIKKKPNFDNYADYMAAYIKQNYGSKKITITALSYGFIVATRMLQRHPELAEQVELHISVIGLADSTDFGISKFMQWKLRRVLRLLRFRLVRWVCYNFFFTKKGLARGYRPDHPKMKAITPDEQPAFIEFEEHLWQINDLQTYGEAMYELFTFHHPDTKIPLEVHHIGTPHDHWLDDNKVQKNLARVYQKVTYHESPITSHGGTAYDSEDEAREMVPPSVVKLMQK